MKADIGLIRYEYERKLGLTAVLLIFLLGVSYVLAEISVGAKNGDWTEYQVAYTGTPTEEHDVTWARMEIKDVEEKSVSVEFTARHTNGTQEKYATSLNLQTGQLGEAFIVPANLNSGDVFFDSNLGNITISDVEERTYAGATRTVVHAATSESTYYWDKATGFLVEGNSQFPDHTMNTILDRTNIWQPQPQGLDQTVFYGLVLVAAVMCGLTITFIVIRRKKR